MICIFKVYTYIQSEITFDEIVKKKLKHLSHIIPHCMWLNIKTCSEHSHANVFPRRWYNICVSQLWHLAESTCIITTFIFFAIFISWNAFTQLYSDTCTCYFLPKCYLQTIFHYSQSISPHCLCLEKCGRRVWRIAMVHKRNQFAYTDPSVYEMMQHFNSWPWWTGQEVHTQHWC